MLFHSDGLVVLMCNCCMELLMGCVVLVFLASVACRDASIFAPVVCQLVSIVNMRSPRIHDLFVTATRIRISVFYQDIQDSITLRRILIVYQAKLSALNGRPYQDPIPSSLVGLPQSHTHPGGK